MTKPLDLSDAGLKKLLRESTDPVLVDFWAPWCVPCKVMSPVLERVSAGNRQGVTVVKLNIDDFPDISREYAVRGIPSLLLFKDGNEISRQTGSKTYGQVNQWLAESITGSPSRPTVNINPPPDWGSFYNDAQLLTFFEKRLLTSAAETLIVTSFNPYWADNKGTTAAAFIRNADPEVFARATGLPVSLGFLLDLCGITQIPHLEKLFSVLSEGKNYSDIAQQFVPGWVNRFGLPGENLIDCADFVTVFEEWRALFAETLSGQTVSGERWKTVQSKATDCMTQWPEYDFQLERNLATVVINMSPPPKTHNASGWASVIRALSFAKYQLLKAEQGWSHKERALPDQRHQWFTAKEKLTPGGSFSENELRQLRSEWLSLHTEFSRKEQLFFQQLPELSAAFNEKQQDILFHLLEQAPDF